MGRKSLKPLRQKAIIKAFYKVAKKEGLENASIAKVAPVWLSIISAPNRI
jgi:hypothetical protein